MMVRASTVRWQGNLWQGKGSMKLNTKYEAPYIDEATFQAEAAKTKENCPVSVTLTDPSQFGREAGVASALGSIELMLILEA
ncbi:MAG: hypothetical protein QF414_01700 [Arenicellales bacterium]|nr:hypothetical protein [Arenicellales bacterium]